MEIVTRMEETISHLEKVRREGRGWKIVLERRVKERRMDTEETGREEVTA